MNGDATVPTAWERTDSRARAHTRTERSRPPAHSDTRSGERRGADQDEFEIPVAARVLPGCETSAAGSEPAGPGQYSNPNPRGPVRDHDRWWFPHPGWGWWVREPLMADALGNAPTPVSEAGDSEAMGGTSIVGTGTMGVPL